MHGAAHINTSFVCVRPDRQKSWATKVHFYFADTPTCCCLLPLCQIVVDGLCYGNNVACHTQPVAFLVHKGLIASKIQIS